MTNRLIGVGIIPILHWSFITLVFTINKHKVKNQMLFFYIIIY